MAATLQRQEGDAAHHAAACSEHAAQMRDNAEQLTTLQQQLQEAHDSLAEVTELVPKGLHSRQMRTAVRNGNAATQSVTTKQVTALEHAYVDSDGKTLWPKAVLAMLRRQKVGTIYDKLAGVMNDPAMPLRTHEARAPPPAADTAMLDAQHGGSAHAAGCSAANAADSLVAPPPARAATSARRRRQRASSMSSDDSASTAQPPPHMRAGAIAITTQRAGMRKRSKTAKGAEYEEDRAGQEAASSRQGEDSCMLTEEDDATWEDGD